VFTPFVLACGVTTALLFAAHGAAFVALRSAPGLAAEARRLGATLLRVSGAVGSHGCCSPFLNRIKFRHSLDILCRCDLSLFI
jgi:cytochrome bd-type quinol oxidase subunit 2